MISTLIFFDATSAQTKGQEYLVNPGVNSATGSTSTTFDTGVDGNGNMPAYLGGWTGGAGGAYALSSGSNGNCHSEDRMFKFNKVGGAIGHYVYQVVEDLPVGNFAWSFWTKWGALVDYDDGENPVKPTFTISTDDDGDGTWQVVETIITTQPTDPNTWVEQTGIYNNQITRDVRIRFHKDGGTFAAPSNLNQLMFIDDVSLKYAGADDDGVGDNADDFPDDATETADADNDGVGDNADVNPNVASVQTCAEQEDYWLDAGCACGGGAGGENDPGSTAWCTAQKGLWTAAECDDQCSAP